ncbi:hypothetical protein BP00DRAFT_55282 [Aspergillus indologenus CBS 114.80]|uniref:BZIP domain-containing protein n=1 Tax=Aspergillus indologenus CBS 114.80 TaxID=1450541 RepID=A0A2V5JEU4_9EURO|nr:hypothetical protein BP00DRAFT_55282 [Aspergillus indologenus CBS 114.80]
MPRIKRKTKEEDLTRVRNNQRHCRQRKRDYVTDLERRLASLENTTSREIRRLQSLTNELLQENERLKALLDDSLDVDGMVPRLRGQMEDDSQSSLERIVNDRVSSLNLYSLGMKNGTLNARTASDTHANPLPPCPLSPSEIISNAFGKCVRPTETTSPEDSLPVRSYSLSSSAVTEQVDGVSLLDTGYLPLPPADAPIPGSRLHPEQRIPGMALQTVSPTDNEEDTTVCAVALELVMSCNTKNFSISELDLRLRAGYRSARFQWEGCRVDNQVLFAVLAEVIG